MTPLQKLPKNVGDLGKLIGAKGFKKLPKVQKIALSGHTAQNAKRERKREREIMPQIRLDCQMKKMTSEWNDRTF